MILTHHSLKRKGRPYGHPMLSKSLLPGAGWLVGILVADASLCFVDLGATTVPGLWKMLRKPLRN